MYNYTFHHRRCKNPQWDRGINDMLIWGSPDVWIVWHPLTCKCITMKLRCSPMLLNVVQCLMRLYSASVCISHRNLLAPPLSRRIYGILKSWCSRCILLWFYNVWCGAFLLFFWVMFHASTPFFMYTLEHYVLREIGFGDCRRPTSHSCHA